MNNEIMITQQDLIDWLDRPPSNDDIDLINFIVCRLDNFYKLKQENEKLNNIINEFDKWLLGEKMMFYKSSDGERLIRYGETTSKWLELKEGDKDE